MRLTAQSDTTLRKISVAAALSIVLLAAACSWDDIDNLHQGPNDTAVGSIIVEPSELQLGGIGDSAFLTATAYDQANRPASDVNFVWSVSDAGVATIDSSGLVKAVGLGLVTVTASTADVAGSATVEVDSEYAWQRACGSCHARLRGDHANVGFSAISCWHCHNPAGETHRQFQNRHELASDGYELLGAHLRLSCSGCHEAGTADLIGSPSDVTDCLACHQTDYDTQHTGSAFPAACISCHTQDTWSGAAVDHPSISGGFDLIGVHLQLACTECHVPVSYAPLYSPSDENDCVTCHQGDYDAQHAGTGYPSTCASCHAQTVWSDGTFDHSLVSGGFDLLGPHAPLACTSCHDAVTAEPLFSPVDESDCISCHQGDYDSQHAGTGYPQTCLSCHAPTTWSGATFDHAVASAGFDLLGPHTPLACTSCHDAVTAEPLFSPIDESDCIACHQGTYDGQHLGSQYPTTCLTCHNGTTWTGANFDHDADYFPIYSGEHRNEWSDCDTCHEQADDYRVFTCFNCHKHNQADMDDEHKNTPGYVYDPPTCLGCHPNGE